MWFLQHTAKVSLNQIHRLVFLTTIRRVWCDVTTESLYKNDITVFFTICHSPHGAMASFMGFHDHTQRRTTVGRTPLDEWSARRTNLYLTTHNIHNRHSCHRWNSNPQSQQSSGSIPTPQTARPLGRANDIIYIYNTVWSSGLPQKLTVPHPVQNSQHVM
jgi:hypothetical protein